MPRCEVMLNQNVDYTPVTLFKSKISALLPDNIDETSDNTNLTEKLMEKLPAAIQFNKSPKKKKKKKKKTTTTKKKKKQKQKQKQKQYRQHNHLAFQNATCTIKHVNFNLSKDWLKRPSYL